MVPTLSRIGAHFVQVWAPPVRAHTRILCRCGRLGSQPGGSKFRVCITIDSVSLISSHVGSLFKAQSLQPFVSIVLLGLTVFDQGSLAFGL